MTHVNEVGHAFMTDVNELGHQHYLNDYLGRLYKKKTNTWLCAVKSVL